MRLPIDPIQINQSVAANPTQSAVIELPRYAYAA